MIEAIVGLALFITACHVSLTAVVWVIGRVRRWKFERDWEVYRETHKA